MCGAHFKPEVPGNLMEFADQPQSLRD